MARDKLKYGGGIKMQYLAGSGSGGVTRPARVSGVKKLLTCASCIGVTRRIATPVIPVQVRSMPQSNQC